MTPRTPACAAAFSWRTACNSTGLVRLRHRSQSSAPDPGPQGAAPLCYHPARASAPPFANPPGNTPDRPSREGDPPPGNQAGNDQFVSGRPMAATGQNSCPPAGRYLAVCGKSLVTAVSPRPGAIEVIETSKNSGVIY